MEAAADPIRPAIKEVGTPELHTHLLPTQPSLLVARNTPFIHRELSWLQFNERVLAEARLSANPILERVKFLAISASNMDEFFMVRFSSLTRSIQNARTDLKQRTRLQLIRKNLLEAAHKFVRRQDETLTSLKAELAKIGIQLVTQSRGEDELRIGREVFAEQILPHLTPPIEFQGSHLQGLENLQIGVFEESGLWIVVPKSLPGVLMRTIADKVYVFFLDDLLVQHSAAALGLKHKVSAIRLTRDADISIDLEEEDTESVPDIVRSNLRTREKGRPMRIQGTGNPQSKIYKNARHRFRLETSQFFSKPVTFFLHQLWTLYSDLPESFNQHKLKAAPGFVPQSFIQVETIFNRLKERDYLFHHPYDSFDSFVRFIEAACLDPQVEQIEQTVYRMDALSPVLEHLKKAAAAQKKVRVIIELRARFDELNNLSLAETLRQAGVSVAFGFGKLKLHAKVALVSRREGDELKYYTHLSTGNYNAKTARIYTDLAMITSHPQLGSDARNFFDNVFEGKIPTGFKQLVSAPSALHRRLHTLIEDEVKAAQQGQRARIVAKMNALVDEALISELYKASAAGVQVDLIVRGACSLIPGVPGLSENIRVISIVDRFLEHSRIYYFGASKAIYLSSADWMPRNFFKRLEIAFPVLDPRIYSYIEQVVIPAYLLDTVKAQELTPQGVWKKRTSSSIRPEDKFASSPLRTRKAMSAQSLFAEIASNGYRGTILAGQDASS